MIWIGELKCKPLFMMLYKGGYFHPRVHKFKCLLLKNTHLSNPLPFPLAAYQLEFYGKLIPENAITQIQLP